MKCLIAIVGPTAVGKSELALHLAQSFPIEIVSADSRQVYKYMDIGTNKPSSVEIASVPHHIIDVVEPDEDFTLAAYCRLANDVIKNIMQKGNLPILVGGTGLYVWSLIEGWSIPHVPPNLQLRTNLENKIGQEGNDALYQELQCVDPAAAIKIHPNNTRRIIRALEIYYITGQPASRLQVKEKPGFPIQIIGLTQQRSELYSKIDLRVDKMIESGLIREVEQLLGKGYSLSLSAMSGIGYKQIGQFLQKEMTLQSAIEKIKYETHRLARHQYAWFSLGDSRINWFDISEARTKATGMIKEFVS